MNFDLVVRGGTLPGGTIADIGIVGETIAAIGHDLPGYRIKIGQ